MFTAIEQEYVLKSGRALNKMYGDEKVPIVEVETAIEMGELTARTFLEFVREHPTANVTLPTGKTPEHVIKAMERMLADDETRVDTTRLHLWQMDEFFPIDPQQYNAFARYIREYYVRLLRLPATNVHLIECTRFSPTIAEHGIEKLFPRGTHVDLGQLEARAPPRSELERLQRAALREASAACDALERALAARGGLDFALLGIGPDGHIAFNTRDDAAPTSRTRLTALNYESAAAAAVDLGGYVWFDARSQAS